MVNILINKLSIILLLPSLVFGGTWDDLPPPGLPLGEAVQQYMAHKGMALTPHPMAAPLGEPTIIEIPGEDIDYVWDGSEPRLEDHKPRLGLIIVPMIIASFYIVAGGIGLTIGSWTPIRYLTAGLLLTYLVADVLIKFRGK